MARSSRFRWLACSAALALPGFAQAATTSAVGGDGGTPYNERCYDGVLIGFEAWFGETQLPPGTFVNALRGVCSRVDKAGNWVGDPFLGTGWVGKQTGTSVRRVCPSGKAVSGFSGRAGWYLDQLTPRCRDLGPNGLLTSSGSRDLSAIGGSGGTPTGFIACPQSAPARGFVGKAGAVIDRFALDCGRLDPPVPGAFTYVRPGGSAVLGAGSKLSFAASGPSLFEYEVCFEKTIRGRLRECYLKSPRLKRTDSSWVLDAELANRLAFSAFRDWHVRAYNSFGEFRRSPTISSKFAPGWAEPVSPINGATLTTRTPTLSWQGFGKWTDYEVRLKGPGWQRSYAVTGIPHGPNTFTLPEAVPTSVGNPIQWWVASCRSTTDQGTFCTPNSPASSFIRTVSLSGTAAPAAPVPASPDNGTQIYGKVIEQPLLCRDVDLIPRLEWHGVSAASRYEWEFRNVTKDKPPKTGSTTSTRATVGGGVYAGDVYRWRVRGVNADGVAGEWSAERSLAGIAGPITGESCLQVGSGASYY